MKRNLEYAYGMKSLVEQLFGNRAWLEVKHSTNIRTWKKYSKRILSALSKTASSTVEIADNEWHEELDAFVKLGHTRIDSANDTESVFASLAASLASINFHQFGCVPCNVRRKQVTLRHPGNWRLNQFRSVQYVQNSNQARAKQAHNKSRKRTASPPLL